MTRLHFNYWLGAAFLAALVLILPPGWFSAWSWEMGLRWCYVALVAFFTVNVLMPPVIAAAPRLGAMDRPDPRKLHTAPTPRLGGLAVFLAILFAIWRSQMVSPAIVSILLAGGLLFALELLDDIRGLSASVRLAGQLVASLVVMSNGMTLQVPFFSHGGLVDKALTVIWLIGVTNAFNFLDGIDGLAGGLGIVCSVFFMGIAWNTQQKELALAAAATAGACAGFLRFNWHPAKVFLGDSGSTFIGFMLAALAVYGSWGTGNQLVACCTPVLILGVPIFDMIYITVARIHRGDVRSFRQWLEYVGRDHFHHRLLHLGMRTQETVFFILTVNVILGLGALAMNYTRSGYVALLLAAQSVLVFLIIVFLMLLGRDIQDNCRELS